MARKTCPFIAAAARVQTLYHAFYRHLLGITPLSDPLPLCTKQCRGLSCLFSLLITLIQRNIFWGKLNPRLNLTINLMVVLVPRCLTSLKVWPMNSTRGLANIHDTKVVKVFVKHHRFGHMNALLINSLSLSVYFLHSAHHTTCLLDSIIQTGDMLRNQSQYHTPFYMPQSPSDSSKTEGTDITLHSQQDASPCNSNPLSVWPGEMSRHHNQCQFKPTLWPWRRNAIEWSWKQHLLILMEHAFVMSATKLRIAMEYRSEYRDALKDGSLVVWKWGEKLHSLACRR